MISLSRIFNISITEKIENLDFWDSSNSVDLKHKQLEKHNCKVYQNGYQVLFKNDFHHFGFTLTVFEIVLFKSRSVLSPVQRVRLQAAKGLMATIITLGQLTTIHKLIKILLAVLQEFLLLLTGTETCHGTIAQEVVGIWKNDYLSHLLKQRSGIL